MKVVLSIPKDERWRCRAPSVHGEHFAYDGREGELIAGAGNDGAWVAFDPPKYVGVPLAWLETK